MADEIETTKELVETLQESVGIQLFLGKKDMLKLFAAFTAANIVTIELYIGTKKLTKKLRNAIEKNRERRESDEVAKRTAL